jgi:hypothetical protein
VSSTSTAATDSVRRSRARPDERDDVVAAREHPRECELRDRRSLRVGDLEQRLDELELPAYVGLL